MGLPNPSRETNFSGANGGREISIFPFQVTKTRIGNLTRLILTLAICDDHTYIHTYMEKEQADVGRDDRTYLARSNCQARTGTGKCSFSLFMVQHYLSPQNPVFTCSKRGAQLLQK